MVGFALIARYQYRNPLASFGSSNLALGKGTVCEVDGSSKDQISTRPAGVTIA